MRYDLGNRARAIIDNRIAINGDAKVTEEHYGKLMSKAL